jgi:hypothetical protein
MSSYRTELQIIISEIYNETFFFIIFRIDYNNNLLAIVDYRRISELKVYWRLNILHGLNTIIYLVDHRFFLVYYALIL